IGGGIVGAGLGTWSLIPGFVLSATGEVIGSPELTCFGVGMVASGIIPDTSLNGTEDDKKSKFQKAKDRMKTYGKGIMRKFWIDKLVKKEATKTETKTTENTSITTNAETSTTTTTDQSTSGMGEVKYYTHPQAEPDPADLAELEKYEEQIRESANSFAQENQISTSENMSGFGDDDRFLPIEEEKIY
ncbi:MAG TPA: hypothetical protein PK637_13315, partial [Flavobacteriales bacterium]|nr:hypothetical protein [Flavobacteriales bacterium]